MVLRRFQQLRSYCDEVETRNREKLQGVFQLQKGYRQPYMSPHIYITTRPTYLGSSRESNLRTHAREPSIVTTKPWRILYLHLLFHQGVHYGN